MGVFLNVFTEQCAFPGLPHVRGGVSDEAIESMSEDGSSPRPWGCFFIKTTHAEIVEVFPTSVGVFLFAD